MADRFWVGGGGNWSDTTHWSTSTGGASGASVPTAADSVFFDQAGTYTVTTTGALTCLDFTVSAGTVAFTNTGTITVSGSMSLLAGTTWSGNVGLTFNATTTGKTVTTNGTVLGQVTFNGVGGGWTLGSSLTLNNALQLFLLAGTLDTSSVGNYSITCGQFSCNGTSTRTLNLNASTFSFSNGVGGGTWNVTTTGLTFNSGTSTIVALNQCTSLGTSTVNTGLNFYNVSFTNTTGVTNGINGINTFNNLSFPASVSAGVSIVNFSANQTINGTLSTTGTAGNRRVFFNSSVYGIGYTLTVNSAPSLTDADFRDLYVIGTAAPISGTRIGNRGNCSGITFDTPKTVYWATFTSGNVSGNNWAASSGGAVNTDNFPLPQDTAIIENTYPSTGNAVGLDSIIGYIGTINTSSRTTSMSLTLSASFTCYGNWTYGSGVNPSGNFVLTFSGGTTQTITSAGKTFTGGITVDTYGGTVQLADALDIGSNTLTITNGTFTTAGFAVTCGALSSSNSNVRTLNFGASTLTFSAAGTAYNVSTTANLTLNAGTSTIVFSSSGTISFNTGGTQSTYYNLSTTGTGGVRLTLNGPCIFNNVTVTAPTSSAVSSILFQNNHTINGTFTCAGASPTQRVFVGTSQSSILGVQQTLTVNALSAGYCDFQDIQILGAASGAAPTNAGDCGNNSGITFPAPKTVYWNLAGAQSWANTGWCTSSGGSPNVNNFPLPQDTAVFDNAGAITSMSLNYTGIRFGTLDMSSRTSPMSIGHSFNQVYIHGDLKNGTGTTWSSGTGAMSFSKNGTQTITSNGVAFGSGNFFMYNPNANVVLADAVVNNGGLSFGSGLFNAGIYNATFTDVSGGTSPLLLKLNLGTATFTLTGAGSVFALQGGSLLQGTATVVLSNTTTTARTFGFASYSGYIEKLVIGGTTGISTLTFGGSYTFGEIASTKTVAHTIAFGTTVQTFGKWSVTGTAGNVVTITGTSTTNVIAGPAVTGVDYLAMGTWGISTTSPGEFYAGANSTGTAAAPVFRTAAPTPRNLYWVGGTGNWSSTTKWSTSSGGAPGAAIPTSLDTVTFDSASNATAYTATIDAGVTIARCAAFTMAGPASGNVTFAGTVPIAFHGTVTKAATGVTVSYTGNMNLSGNSSYTLIWSGNIGNTTVLNSPNATWTLGASFSNSFFTLTNGSFNTAGYGLSNSGTTFPAANKISLDLGASAVSIVNTSVSIPTNPNITLNAGTSTVSMSYNYGLTTNAIPRTFYNLTIQAYVGSGAFSLSGVNTFNTVSVGSSGNVGTYGGIEFGGNQTIASLIAIGNNGGTGNAYRTFLRSNVIGTPRTLTVASVGSGIVDVDFRDIVFSGAASPLSGTRLGDCKGNSGITFPAAKTVYYRQTGSINWMTSGTGSWSFTSGGAFNATAFPLPQDTAVFPAATYPAFGATTTLNGPYSIGTIDMSLRTSNTMTLATGTQTPAIYGDWINGTGITLTGGGEVTFAGRGSQTITSASRTFTQSITVNSVSGSVTLQDSFVTSIGGVALTLTAGAFNANNYNVTFTNASGYFSSSNINTRTLAIGSGTWIIPSSNPWIASTATNFTVTGTGTISLTSASAKTFAGGGISYSGITLNQGGVGTLTISGNNTFANITNTAVATGATTINFGASSTTVGAFTATGAAGGKVLTITGTSAASPATLIYTGAGSISGLDYLVTTFVRAYPTTATWYAGANSTNGGSLGWIFSAPPANTYNVYIVESNRASDSVAGTSNVVYDSTVSNSASAIDNIVAAAVFRSAVSNTANATDTTAAAMRFASSVSNTVNATDSIAAKATFGSAVSNTVNVSDASSAKQAFGSSVSNTVTVTDTASAAQGFGTSISEQTNASETVAAAQGFSTNISEQVNASETTFAVQVFNSNASEQAGAQAVGSASIVFNGAVSDSARAQDTVSSRASFGSALSETARASDTNTATATFRTNIADTARALDSTLASATFRGAVSDFARVQDVSAVAASIFNAPVSETARASETAASTAAFGSNVSNTVQITDTLSSKVDFLGSVAESATALDSISAAQRFATAITESNTISNTVASSAVFNALVYAGGLNTITQLTSTLPTGTSFAGATIFNASSASGGLTVAANGTGLGNSGGFNAGGNYILFTGANTRSVKTIPLNLTSTTTVSFYMIKGTSSNGGEQPDANENITFSYSINGGSSYIVVSTVILGGTTPVVNPFTLFSINLPVGAKTASTILKWEETTSSAGINDAYGLKDITLTSPGSVSASETNTARATFGSAVSDTVRVSDAPSSKAVFGSAVNDTVQISDSNVGFIRFPGSITESVQVSDQDSAQAAFAPRITESARAQDVSAVAASTFNAAAADTARALDSTSSSQAFGSNVANTVRVSDSPSTQASFGSAVSEAAAALDSVRSNPTFASQVANSIQVSDASSAAASFGANFSATVQAQDAAASSQRFGSSIAETARTSETTVSRQRFGSNISEFATAQDAAVGRIQFPGSVVESVIAQDAAVGRIQFPGNVSESATAQDSITTALRIGSSVSESATVQDSTSSLRILPGRVSESARVQESVVASAIFRGIIEEAVRGSDQLSTSVVFLAAFSEFARAYADSVGYLTLPSSVSESGRVSDSAAAAGALRGYISESATGSDSIAAKFFHATFINELATALDSVDAPGSTYNAAVSDSAQALDAAIAGAIFYAAVIAYAGITDLATARYLWELIDDSQTPNWGTIDDTQSAGWVEVNDIQAASWQNVGNTQADGWTQIDDTQDPDWVRITP